MLPTDDASPDVPDAGLGDWDLGPLAWVLVEIRKSLDVAVRALRRFVRDTQAAQDSDIAAVDVGMLLTARQQLHQAGGALDMVGMQSPALLLRAMEDTVQRFFHQPELCSEDAVGVIERAGFGLGEYLELVLAGNSVSAVALFPQYRDVQMLSDAGRVHPADLWPEERIFGEFEIDLTTPPVPYAAQTRKILDETVLRVVKDSDFEAAHDLRDLALGLAAGQHDRHARTFWIIAAAFFDAYARGMFSVDLYAKRVVSRVLMQYVELSCGNTEISQRLVHELLFFCAQARLPAADPSPLLAAVRKACGLEQCDAVEYTTPRFGHFDPAILAKARKRISAAAEVWSAVAGGDRNKLKSAADQFGLVCDSLRKLNDHSQSLAEALMRAADQTARSGEPPSASLAVEVATAVLYLQAVLAEPDIERSAMDHRADELAQRLDEICSGKQPAPLESWMEELYRRVSDNQTMGSVVQELRASLNEAEQAMDQFFRSPNDPTPLARVPERLSQMRGVLSVLGLDQASHAVLRMRDSIEGLLRQEPSAPQARQGLFERLGTSLGALGFMFDMLGYQPVMARKLFVYDEELGELRLVVGRTNTSAPDAEPNAVASTEQKRVVAPAFGSGSPAGAVPATSAALAENSAAPGYPAPQLHSREPEVDAELLDIFLTEAHEVVATGLAAAKALATELGDLNKQTTLRRAFHTLKGSSRMVGLSAFGEAAWSMEQMLNVWLAEQKPIEPALLETAEKALQGFGRWANDIAAGDDLSWNASAFTRVAEAMRMDGNILPLVLPGEAAAKLRSPEDLGMDGGPLGKGLPSDLELRQVNRRDDEDASADQASEQAQENDDWDSASEQLDFSETIPLHLEDFFQVQDDRSQAELLAPQPAPVGAEIDFSELQAAPIEALNRRDDELPTEPSSSAPDDTIPAPTLPSDPAASDGMEVGNAPTLPAGSQLQEAPEETATGALPPLPEGGSVPGEAEPGANLEDRAEERVSSSADDENIKTIGSLRISLPLYNVYLNEADEWSRRLCTVMQEWALELDQPLPDTAVALAHSLAGSSATVGFHALSQIARLLEHALAHAQLETQGDLQHAKVFLIASEEIRRLLHQFAAGFLKSADEDIEEKLRQILASDVSTLSPPIAEDDSKAVVADCDTQVPADAEAEDGDTSKQPLRGHVAPALTAVRGDGKRTPDTAAAAQPAVRTAIDDDIDALDAMDADLFPIFEEEAGELLPQMGSALRQWMARPDNAGSRGEVLRALHTLKGSARLAGAMRLGEMAHRMESAVEQLDMETLSGALVEPLLGNLDTLERAFRALRIQDEQVAVASEAAGATELATHDREPARPKIARLSVMDRPFDLARPMPAKSISNQSVRVRALLLDRMVNQAGEVMITRVRMEARLAQLSASLGDLTINLSRLRGQLRDIEIQSESQMQSRLALSKDTAAGFDPLEFDRFTRVQELTRMMAESVNDVATVQRNLQQVVEGTEDDLIAQGRQAKELQRDLLRTRMVEFEGIAERLYAVVRRSSKEVGKQIKLDILGGTIEMDRGVIDRMSPAFEHLLRNCVAHGIESPEQRIAAGKDAVGTISVTLQQVGNDVAVEFRDDGAGLNLDRIRARALELNLVEPSASVTDEEAAGLIFTPGFSTATEVTEIAGRGIGMDVVRSEVIAFGGRIETSTVSGRGTAFRLVLPLTTAVTQVVMLRAGSFNFGVPSTVVEQVRRISAADVVTAYANSHLEVAGEQIPFFWAGALLQASGRSHEAIGKTRFVVVLRSASQRIAMHVDDVLGNQEVVVKNLGPQLSRLPGLAGMSVLATGAVVLIYNPVALATVYGDEVRQALARSNAEHAQLAGGAAGKLPALASVEQLPLVLVVDDSITVRRVTQRLLLREGYRVVLAADGLQALERLQEERPTVVLSDIEMPRMDGFDLARNIRADAKLSALPIIMITSRIAQKHRDLASALGVNHYLGKPYSDEQLLDLVRHYAQSSDAHQEVAL